MDNLFVFTHLLNDRSGSPTVLCSSMKALNAGEQGILFVGSQGHGVLDDTGVTIQRYWYRRSRYKLVTFFSYFFSQYALYRALTKANYIPLDAIVFVNTLLPIGAMLWGKRTGRTVIVHLHEISVRPTPLRWILTFVASRCAQKLLYVSQEHYSRLQIKGVPASIVPNPIDQKIAQKASNFLPQRKPVFRILMLTYLREYKGVNEFMQLARALQHRSDIAFDLVLNADPNEVEEFRENYPKAPNVTIHERTDEPSKFYCQANLVLNLSRVDLVFESFGLTLIEAMAFGIPVIAPPVGGPAEIVSHGVEGYCIDSRDTKELANSVLRIVEDETSYIAMSLAAKRRAEDYSFASFRKNLIMTIS